MTTASPKIAVLIPCYNEAVTIAKVVDDFARELPEADIYVYDNNSTDGTADIARAHGAILRKERRQGKGNVMRSMFREIEADCYVLVDGDDTYPAEDVHALIKPILDGEADMVIGDRLTNGTYGEENTRAFHGMGNSMVRGLINHLYKAKLTDIMTGYRAFNRIFIKSYPVVSSGFEIETDMSIHALDKRFRIAQVPITYRDRPEGSYSKLSTFSDGLLVLRTIAALFREYKPMRFFGWISLVMLVACLACGIPVLVEFARTSFVTHVPLAILACGLAVLTVLFFVCGLILDTNARDSRRQYELMMYNIYQEGLDNPVWIDCGASASEGASSE